MNRSVLHEAGYDSYITGICFASLAKFIEKENYVEYSKLRAKGPVIIDRTNNNFLSDESINKKYALLYQSKRTDVTALVPSPNVTNVTDISNKPI